MIVREQSWMGTPLWKGTASLSPSLSESLLIVFLRRPFGLQPPFPKPPSVYFASAIQEAPKSFKRSVLYREGTLLKQVKACNRSHKPLSHGNSPLPEWKRQKSWPLVTRVGRSGGEIFGISDSCIVILSQWVVLSHMEFESFSPNKANCDRAALPSIKYIVIIINNSEACTAFCQDMSPLP